MPETLRPSTLGTLRHRLLATLAGLGLCLALLALTATGASAAGARHHRHVSHRHAGHARHLRRHRASYGHAAGWHGYGPRSQPQGAWRPYSSSSPFNQPAASARPVANSNAIVQDVISRFGEPAPLVAGAAGTANDFGHPVYFAQATDPVMTLHATASWGSNPLNGMRIPVPPQAVPAGGADGHMTVVTPDGWEYDFWETHREGSALYFSWGGRTRIDGTGLGSAGTASGFGNLAGIIRPEELASGHIDHALFIVLRCTSDATSFGYGTRASGPETDDGAYVYPADHGGSSCGDDPNLPPLGARFVLDMTAGQIQALNVPTWKKTILTALAQYGGYVGDTGGAGFGFEFESGASYTSYGLKDPFVTIAQHAGLSAWNGEYAFNMANGLDWARYLQVVAPPHTD